MKPYSSEKLEKETLGSPYIDYQEGVSVYEVLVVIVRNWRILAVTVGAACLLMLGYVFLIAETIYESETDLTINIHDAETKYGVFRFSSENPNDYIDLIYSDAVLRLAIRGGASEKRIVDLREAIRVERGKREKSFRIVMQSDSVESAQANLEIVINAFMQVIRYRAQHTALSVFKQQFIVEQLSLEDSSNRLRNHLALISEQLEKTDRKIVLSKLLASNPEELLLMAKEMGMDLQSLSESSLMEEVFNPMYITLEQEKLKLQQEIIALETRMTRNMNSLEEIDYYIGKMLETRDISSLTSFSDVDIGIVTNQFTSSPWVSTPEKPVAPRKTLLMAAAFIVSSIVGVIVILLKEFWNKERRRAAVSGE